MAPPQKAPALRAQVESLIAQLLPVVQQGGRLKLSSLIAAALNAHLSPEARQALEGRDELWFEPSAGEARFENVGRARTIQVGRARLRLPSRLSGRARAVTDGVELIFDKAHAPVVEKWLFSVPIERIRLTSREVLVDLEGDAFDRRLELT